MQARKFFLLIIALLIAGGTVMLAKSMLKTPGSMTASTASVAPATDEILVAARDLPIGTLLKDADLKWQAWPKEGDMANFAVKNKNDMSEYVGAVVRQSLHAGEPIMTGKIVRAHEQGFLAAVLDPGMRALSVPITPAGGVAGFLFPGDHVDVIVTHQVTRKTDPDPNGHKVSETILTNVRVLALDQRTDDQLMEPKIAQIATLEVTSKQAETLALVTQIGTLSLVLRGLAADPNEPPGINAATLESVGLTEKAQKTEANDITWDSDISHVLAKPGNRQGAVQRIQIMRGKDTSETIFDLQQ